MLLNRDTAEGIANGRITLVLRRWDVARAKRGGTQRTSAGTIRIDAVTEYPGSHRVTAAQALVLALVVCALAGGSAQAALDRRPARHTYSIEVSFLAPTSVRNSPRTTNSATTTSKPSPRGCVGGTP